MFLCANLNDLVLAALIHSIEENPNHICEITIQAMAKCIKSWSG
jgi:hypothetical protein